MTTGLLEVHGAIALDQFWPVGTSDADTTKIKVAVSPDAFRFRASPSEPFRPTHVFADAIVDGESRAPAIANGHITVRLQGIDAPELHYRPAAALPPGKRTPRQHTLYLAWNFEYRQYLAETAADALHGFLAQFNRNPLPCRIVTAVDTPNDVFDTYARLIGDLIIDSGATSVNLNHWLVENGHALPAFYVSLDDQEITTLTDLYNAAKANRRGLWNDYFTPKLAQFGWSLRFRGRDAALDPLRDRGPVIVPKLFRRQATFRVNKRAGMASGSLAAYLRTRRDEMHLVDEFLEQGPGAATIYHWHELLVDNELRVDPAQIVFRERASRIRKPGGAPVEW